MNAGTAPGKRGFPSRSQGVCLAGSACAAASVFRTAAPPPTTYRPRLATRVRLLQAKGPQCCLLVPPPRLRLHWRCSQAQTRRKKMGRRQRLSRQSRGAACPTGSAEGTECAARASGLCWPQPATTGVSLVTAALTSCEALRIHEEVHDAVFKALCQGIPQCQRRELLSARDPPGGPTRWLRAIGAARAAGWWPGRRALTRWLACGITGPARLAG